MKLTKRFRIKTDERLLAICKVANNLYNQTLYYWQQRRDNDNEYLKYYALRDEMRNVPNLEGTKNYYLMNAHVSEFVIKLVYDAIDSFYKQIKDWKQHPEKYRAKPEFPHYHKSGGFTEVQFDAHEFKIKDGLIIYNKKKGYGIPIPQRDKWEERFKRAKIVRVLPNQDYMIIEVVYEAEVQQANVDIQNVAAIDLGVDNLATLVSASGCTIYNGKPLKSYNQYFNKKLAKAKSILDKQQPERRSSKRIRQMYDKRDRYIDTYMHTVSCRIVEKLVVEHIGLLVVGRNKGWKQEANMGKVSNQRFTQIPFFKLQDQLRYKCEMVGIKYVEQEEGYTSKCDALAMESIEHHDSYEGNRKKRGLFQSSTNKLINADQNGALNILRKYLGDELYKEATKDWKLPAPINIVNNFIKQEKINE